MIMALSRLLLCFFDARTRGKGVRALKPLAYLYVFEKDPPAVEFVRVIRGCRPWGRRRQRSGGSEVRCGHRRWRWLEDGSEIGRGNVERRSARVRCTSRRSREAIRRAVSRAADEVVMIETQGPRSYIHEKRATGHRQGIIDVRRHADTMDADTIDYMDGCEREQYTDTITSTGIEADEAESLWAYKRWRFSVVAREYVLALHRRSLKLEWASVQKSAR